MSSPSAASSSSDPVDSSLIPSTSADPSLPSSSTDPPTSLLTSLPNTTTTTTTMSTTTTSTSSSTTTSPTSTTSLSTSTTSNTTSTTSNTTTTSSSQTPDLPTTTSSSNTPPSTTSDLPVITSPPTTSPTPEPTSNPHTPTRTTFSTVVFISTTDHRGSPTRTAPSEITSTFTSTGTDGGVITVTQVIANPSLIPNNSRSKGNGFFGNTGAVAAVFVLVGLAATSIALWIFFAIRRRHRQLRAQLTAAVAASQAASTHRLPLDDDDDPHGPRFNSSALEMSHRPSSSALGSAYLGRLSYHDDPDHADLAFNPYADFGFTDPGPVGSRDGYMITRTGSPPAAYLNGSQGRSRRPSVSGSLGSASALDGYIMGTHSTTPSGASYEPLLASYYRQSSGQASPVLAAQPATAVTATKAPSDKSTQPLVDDREPTETHSALTSETTDDRMDPGLRRRQKEADSASVKDLKDEEDYSRPILGPEFTLDST